MSELDDIRARRAAAERDPRNYTGRMLADIDTLLAMVDALTGVWTQVVAIAEESTNSSTYISAYNMSRVRDVVRDWKEAQHAVLE